MNQKEKAILYVIISLILPLIFGLIGYFLKILQTTSNNTKRIFDICGTVVGIIGVPFLIIFYIKFLTKKDEN